MARNFNPELRPVVERELEARGWNYDYDAKDGVFTYGLNLHGRIKSVRCLVQLNTDSYCVYAVSPISAQEDDAGQMHRVAEFISRANYGLRNGNFELDFRDGEIRYKCYVNCDGQIPCGEIVHDSMSCPPAMFLRYGPGLLDMLFGEKTPESAVRECEDAVLTASRDEEEEQDEPEDETPASGLLRMLRGMHAADEDAGVQ